MLSLTQRRNRSIISSLFSLPAQLLAGLLLVAIAWPICLVRARSRLAEHSFFPLWLGYILTVDGIGRAPNRQFLAPTSSGRRFVGLFLVSIPFWWIFEAVNDRLGNWEYLFPRDIGFVEHHIRASIAFSTVVPALFETAELYWSTGLPRRLGSWNRFAPSRRGLLGFIRARRLSCSSYAASSGARRFRSSGSDCSSSSIPLVILLGGQSISAQVARGRGTRCRTLPRRRSPAASFGRCGTSARCRNGSTTSRLPIDRRSSRCRSSATAAISRSRLRSTRPSMHQSARAILAGRLSSFADRRAPRREKMTMVALSGPRTPPIIGCVASWLWHDRESLVNILDRFEQSFERLMEGSVGRLFRSPVQPAEIGRKLERAMVSNQVVSVDSTLVPNDYRVAMHPQDMVLFVDFVPALCRQMEAWLNDARRRSRVLDHRPDARPNRRRRTGAAPRDPSHRRHRRPAQFQPRRTGSGPTDRALPRDPRNERDGSRPAQVHQRTAGRVRNS